MANLCRCVGITAKELYALGYTPTIVYDHCVLHRELPFLQQLK